MLTCSVNSFLVTDAIAFFFFYYILYQMPTFTITDRKLYVPVVTLSTQDNVKLLKKLESGFKKTINWNKYQSKMTTFLHDPSFQGVNRLSA